MEPRAADRVVVLEVDAPLADALAGALRRRGLPAWTAEGDEGHVVLVPRDRRDEALQLIAASMDELAAAHADRARPATPPAIADDEEPQRRLLLPRLRDGGLVVLLVPLLVVALSAINFPARYAALVVIAGMVVIVALRERARRDE